jgi:hypothetical protein
MASIASTINSDAGRRYKEFLGRELTKEILQ